MPKTSNRNRSTRRGGVMDVARDRPLATAAAAAAAVGAGVFLWSRRNQISDQLSDLSDQISEWSQSFGTSDDTGGFLETETGDSLGAGTTRGTGRTGTTSGRTGTTRVMSETGGGNASLGARTGGGGSTGSVSGRGRARSIPTT